MKKLIIAGTAVGVMAFAGVAAATGPEGAIVGSAGHVCSGTTGPVPSVPAAPGGSCTYTSTVPGGYIGVGPFTITATHVNTATGATVTDLTVNCALGPCSSGPDTANGLALAIPAGDTVTVSAGTGGGVAAGTVTNGPTPAAP